jgi:hypothetical protein
MIFLAIPVSTVLHGCESWARNAQHINKLQVFFHQSIRRILCIDKWRVEHERIKNEYIHNFFSVAEDIIDSIRLRQLQWLGKLERQPDSLPTKQLLSAWAPAAHRGGAHFIALRNFRIHPWSRLYWVEAGSSQRVVESRSISRRQERYIATILAVGRFAIIHSKSFFPKSACGNLSLYVYRTVIYWGRLGEQLGEDQMSRNYSSTIVAMYRRKNIFGICFSMVFDGWLTYGWNFPVPEVELGEGPCM